MIAYLSGAMENAPRMGSVWRNNITDWLKNEFGHAVFDPVVESKKIIQKSHSINYKSWKYSDPGRYKNFIRSFIDRDLKLIIQKTDYLIVLWDDNVIKGGGTHGEITMAYYKKIPIFLVNRMQNHEISGWIFSCATEVFDSFDELKLDFIKRFNQ
tara:strand:- start:316 stop:780 length:465 start_codon:yes stop_codon:yes gene_type:complete